MESKRKSTLGSDAVKLTVSKVITLVISILSAMLLARFRTLEEYGTYSQLLLITGLVTSLLMAGLPNSINYFLARAESIGEKQRFLSVYYTLSTALSILSGFILVCTAPLIIQYFKNDAIKSFIYFLAVFPLTSIITSSIENVLVVFNKTSLLFIYKLLNSTLLLLIIVAVQLLHLNFTVYMIMLVVLQCIFALSVYIIVKDISGKLYILFDRAIIKQVLAFSLPIGLASVVGNINMQLDKLVIGKLMNTAQLAIYTNASVEIPVTVIAASLTAVLMPKLVCMLKDGQYSDAVKLWGNSIILSYVAICFSAAALFIFAPEVMTLLYSEKYLSGVSVFRVYSLVLLLRCTYFGMILNAKGRTRFILYSSIAALALNLAFNLAFFKAFGFAGPAIATLISTLIIALCQLYATSNLLRIPFLRIFPWKELLRISLINIVWGVVFFILKKIIPMDLLFGKIGEALVLGLIWSLLYLCSIFGTVKNNWSALKIG